MFFFPASIVAATVIIIATITAVFWNWDSAVEPNRDHNQVTEKINDTENKLLNNDLDRHRPASNGNGPSASALRHQFTEAIGSTDNQPLWDFIEQFELSTESEHMTREALDFRLLGLNNLINRVKHTDQVALVKALRSLDTVLFDRFLSVTYPDANLYADLQRFFDMAIRVCVPTDHGQLVKYLLFRQGPDGSGRLQSLPQNSTFVAIYFSPWSEENGFALYYPSDRQKAQKFELPFSRTQIKEAIRKEETLALDEVLVSLIRQDIDSGIPIILSWDDTACWSPQQQDANAITTKDWCFNESITIEEIMGQMK
jgi:hypothetical protein